MKKIALAFDDGPIPGNTDRIIQALRKHNADATFMIWGEHAQTYPEGLVALHQNGFEIGSHTYSHPSLPDLDNEEINKQIEKTDSLIYSLIGKTPQMCRPPYGDIDKRSARQINKAIVTWSLDSEDWKSHDEQQIYSRMTTLAKDGDICLLHDLQPATANILDKILIELEKQDFSFVRVSKLYADKMLPMHLYKSAGDVTAL
ncbi:polysaccharide deacetylase family protein [Lapidilactobacillus bayanensis]|uniref:polysaccharide deacetylase family protein n=1 Tax=Lapidilactobacillus bayanensis TaxID=2485998 RepID=UPI000F766F38|nr:polysaccharide deacetylase family protein [Lapidilactobacillus bayanensis]